MPGFRGAGRSGHDHGPVFAFPCDDVSRYTVKGTDHRGAHL